MNLVKKKSFDSYCVWMLLVRFCKIHIFITILEITAYDEVGGVNSYCIIRIFFRSHVPYYVQE